MSNRDPDARYETVPQGVPWMIEQWVRLNVHTVSLGRVVEYDSETKRARIQPVLRTLYNDGTAPTEKPPILNVPLRQPASGGHLVHHQVDAGDVVLLLFSSRGLDAFKERWGEISDPDRGSYFQMRDALALHWGSEDVSPVRATGWIVQNAEGSTYLSVDGDTIRLVTGQAMLTATPASLRLERGNSTIVVDASGIRISGDVRMDDSLDVDGSNLRHGGTNVGRTHTHAGVQSGPSRTGNPG